MPLIFENMNEEIKEIADKINKTIKEPQFCINCKNFDPKDKWASFTCLECSFYETNQQTNYESTKPKS